MTAYRGVYFGAEANERGLYILTRNGDMVMGREFGSDAARIAVEAADQAYLVAIDDALSQVGDGPMVKAIRNKLARPLHPPIPE